MRRSRFPWTAPALALALGACAAQSDVVSSPGPDPHSFARYDEVAVRHLELDLTVDFEAQRLSGRASLTLDRRTDAARLILDTRDLEIEAVTSGDGTAARFALGEEVPFLGRPLVIELGPETEIVHVDYRTRPEAAALGWHPPEQTAGGEAPFLLSQSQAILARTWIPLQDTPAVRMTYEATLRVPPGLLALMSAENPTEASADGVHHFRMSQPIPSYLMAIAVGKLAFRPLDERSGVYAEPGLIEAAAWELAEMPAMITAAEELYGPYRWGRYDVLFLPPSFPFGGMENPRLTFATPTILAGDRSLTALIAHELAHSWSGNLVTNADWNDFWLNEGFTTYFEHRIMEAVAGREYSEMLSLLSLRSLEKEVAELGAESPDTHLHLDLAGRDPDDGMTSIAYDKGYYLLRLLEEKAGRERWDATLRDYFDHFAFEPITTEAFLDFAEVRLGSGLLAEARVYDWIYRPGIPDNLPHPTSGAFAAVEAELAAWLAGKPASEIASQAWSTHEWLHFIDQLPEDLDSAAMATLDEAFALTASNNSEILAAWLEAAIRRGYCVVGGAVGDALESFLGRVGRRKFLKPLYQALSETPEGLADGRRIYAEARAKYHAVAVATIDAILGVSASD